MAERDCLADQVVVVLDGMEAAVDLALLDKGHLAELEAHH